MTTRNLGLVQAQAKKTAADKAYASAKTAPERATAHAAVVEAAVEVARIEAKMKEKHEVHEVHTKTEDDEP